MDNVGSDTEQMADLCHCPIRLVTMAGKEIETTAPLSICHHWEMLEDYSVELLAKCHDLDTFGCELTLISEDTRSPLNDPIHEELWEHNRYQFFFHEYGRRVGMVPRSSLKEGKNRQMVEKGTKTPKPTQTKHPSPQAETPPSCSLSSTLGETCETETSGN